MLRIGGRAFRPHWISSAAAAVVLTIAVLLGNWQVRRAGEKLALQQQLDARSRGAPVQIPARAVDAPEIEYARVAVRGEYLPQFTILLDNRVLNGTVGYQVLTPIRITGGDMCVLVNRGWVKAGATRDALPQFPTPTGTQSIEGIAVPPLRRFLELAPPSGVGPVWQNLVLDRYAELTKLSLQRFVIQQAGGSDDGLTRITERPDVGIDMHRGYAFQWYSLAALILVLYVVLNFKRVEN